MKSNTKSQSKKIFPKIILVLVSLIFTLFLAEIALRYYFFGSLSIAAKTPDSKFIGYDEQLGWSNIPNSEGYFENYKEGFKGYVKFDENGIRVNDNNLDNESEAILIVGDSVTAGMEVNNNETYSAVLERMFFENGCEYRVYNAGVRGYGTDQSFWNMERLVEIINPKYVIYMFTSNDLQDNKTIKQSNRVDGKPVFIFDENKLTVTNRPAKKLETNRFAFVTYNGDGYEIYEGDIDENLRSVMEFIKNNFALYYPLNVLYQQLQVSPMAVLETKAEYPDMEILELILQSMKRDDIELFITSFPYDGEEVYIDDFIRISDRQGMTYLNIYPYFTEQWENYHWKKDRHWNEKGHLQAATGLYELLSPQLCDN